MAVRRWIGAARQVTQIVDLAPAGGWAGANTITLTIDGIDCVLTIGSLTSTSQVATSLYQAFMGIALTDTTATCTPTIAEGGFKSVPQFAGITASNDTAGTCRLTANATGIPFTISIDETAAGSITRTDTAVATGKWFWDNPDNWSGDTVPVTGDTVIFDSGNIDCRYNLVTGIQPAFYIQTMGYTGKIGLDETNTDLSGYSYPEYRTRHLTFTTSATGVYTFGQGTGPGSGRTRIDLGTGTSTIVVYQTGARSNSAMPALTLIANNAANDYTFEDGDVGLSWLAGETTAGASLRVGTDTGGRPQVYVGSDCGTITTGRMNSGDMTIFTSITTFTQVGGNVNWLAGAPATLNLWGGTMDWRSVTTIATAVSVGSGAKFDRTVDTRVFTITPVIQLYKGSSWLDPNGVGVYTAGFKTVGCRLTDVNCDFGFSRTHTVA